MQSSRVHKGHEAFQCQFSHSWLLVAFESQHGGSGGPVWNPKSGGAVGLVSGGRKHAVLVSPLEHPLGGTVGESPGILNAPGMYPLHLIISE